jgi:isopenicillin-N epimerase
VSLRDEFLLDPEVVFLNHGSFGATPIPVFAEYQRWQRELERQPVEFLSRRADDLLDAAREPLAAYLNADPGCLVYVPNATSGVNVVARSLRLEPGDEVLGNDLEYGACDETWDYLCRRAGAAYIRHHIALPLESPEALADALWAGVTPRTRVVYLSHVTSGTALTLPVAEICRRAREAGILSVVDGAHVPGHLPLDLEAIGADAYSGNLHKWLCAPKGSGFLFVRPEHHAWVESSIVSWGWVEGSDVRRQGTTEFVNRNQRQGTRDLAAYLRHPGRDRVPGGARLAGGPGPLPRVGEGGAAPGRRPDRRRAALPGAGAGRLPLVRPDGRLAPCRRSTPNSSSGGCTTRTASRRR